MVEIVHQHLCNNLYKIFHKESAYLTDAILTDANKRISVIWLVALKSILILKCSDKVYSNLSAHDIYPIFNLVL